MYKIIYCAIHKAPSIEHIDLGMMNETFSAYDEAAEFIKTQEVNRVKKGLNERYGGSSIKTEFRSYLDLDFYIISKVNYMTVDQIKYQIIKIKENNMKTKFKVEGNDLREFGDDPEIVFSEEFDTEEDALSVGIEVLRRISDIYGGSYVNIFECDSEDEDLIETLSGIYDANANPDLTQFNAKEFLKSNTANYSNLKKIIENYKDSSNGSTESANEIFISALCDWCQNDDLFKELYNIITDNLYNDAFPKALQYIINNKKQ